MNAPKFTPGPWHVANGVQVRSEHDQIAKVWMMRNGEGNANARLIAAAPELYEALEGVLDWIDNWSPNFLEDPEWPQTHANIRAALAKARGEA